MTPLELARQFAALSGPFAPGAALHAVQPPPVSVGGAAMAVAVDAAAIAEMASALAAACDTGLDNGRHWLLRSGERSHVLQELQRSGGLAAAIAARRQQALQPDDEDLLAALAGDAGWSADALATRLADPDTSRETVARIATALDRAGTVAPGHGQLATARAVLSRIDGAARREAFAARGFFGRVAELQSLQDWLSMPLSVPPARAAYIAGGPGIGKSTLLEEVTARMVEAHDAIAVRLDFDRAGLDVTDLLGLTMEVARQVAERVGDAGKPLLAARLAAASTVRGDEAFAASTRSRFPETLAAALATALDDRSMLLILDTVEVLRARGEQHPARLFDWIDQLLLAGAGPRAILAAGRGMALDGCPDRIGLAIDLQGLDGDATIALIDRLGVPEAARDTVAALADGNPLVLRLAATIVARFGAEDLPVDVVDKGVAAAFLYRFLLSRIDDPDLRALAHPGLIARRISADFLRDVLAPALSMPPLSPERAQALFASLAGQHWLVEIDPGARGFVRHRGDMRALLLPLLYKDQPALCARVDAAAARWFAGQSDDGAVVDAAYHRLQLLRSRRRVAPLLPETALRFDSEMIAELPARAQDVVRRAAGGRSSLLREPPKARLDGDDPALVAEILHLVEREDYAEGQYVVEQMTLAGIDPASRGGEAIRAFYWRAGRWRAARQSLAARDRTSRDDRDIAALPLPLALTRLEMRAEFAPKRIAALLMLPGIEAVLTEAERLPGGLARQGALAFGLAGEGWDWKPMWSSRDGDAVTAALALWRGDGGAPPAKHAFGVARDRLGARGLESSPARIGWDNPQLLAALTPYAVFAGNLAVLARQQDLIGRAADADRNLSAAGALFTRDGPGGGLAPVTGNPIASLAGLGLFAEWAVAEAFVRANPDLAEIGAAAERWRRTVAGDWRYPRQPPGWLPPGGLDHSLAARVTALAAADEPVAVARAQLSHWGHPEPILAVVQRRRGAAVAAARAAPDPAMAAAALVAGDVPAAFVPPLAILVQGEK